MADSHSAAMAVEEPDEVDRPAADHPGQGELQRLGPLGHRAEGLGGLLGARPVVGVQPVDERGRQLGAGPALAAEPEGVEVEGLEVLPGQPRQVGRASVRPSGGSGCRPGAGPGGRGSRSTTRATRSGSSRADPVEPDGLDVGGQGGRVGVATEPEEPVEVVAVELEEPGVVEVAQASGRAVDAGRARSSSSRARADRRHRPGVGQEPGVRLHRAQPAHGQLLLHVVDHRPPDVHLGDLEPEQRPEVLGRELEERPLVALEVAAQGECRRRPPGRVRGRAGPRSRRRRSSWSRSTSARAACSGWGTNPSASSTEEAPPPPRPVAGSPRLGPQDRPDPGGPGSRGRCRGGRGGPA